MATAENVWAWSTTAGSNDAADSSINWVEGQDPGTVNNSARGMMAATKKWANVNSGNVTVGGTADAITVTTGQAISSGHQALGFRICFKAASTNTGATTVAVDGLSAVAVQRPNGDALSAGDIVSGAFHDIAFDGTNYRLFAAGVGGSYGSLSGSNTWTGTNSFNGTTTVGNDVTDVVVIKNTTVNSAMSALLSSSSVAALRTAMGLGTAAVQNTGTSGATVPLLSGINTWSTLQTMSRSTGSATDAPLLIARPDASGLGYYFTMFTAVSGALIGSITTNNIFGTNVIYNTTSDDRLKSGQRPIDDSGAILDQLAPIRFRWKDETGPEDFGFSAQQLHQIVPQAVTPGKGNPGDKDFIPWQMQHGRLEAILVAEIKALRARVAALEAGVIVLDRVPLEDVERIWPFVLPLIRSACDAVTTDLTPDFIKEEALADRRTLWVIFDTDDPFGPFLAAFATGERLTAQGRVVFIDALGGRNRGCWLVQCLAELEAQAKAMGAVAIEAEGRMGWKRVLPGYREVRTILRKAL